MESHWPRHFASWIWIRSARADSPMRSSKCVRPGSATKPRRMGPCPALPLRRSTGFVVAFSVFPLRSVTPAGIDFLCNLYADLSRVLCGSVRRPHAQQTKLPRNTCSNEIGSMVPRKTAVILAVLFLASCTQSHSPSEAKAPPYRVYVTNETSGELSVIDPVTLEVTATVPLGKRPRGIHASPDGKTIYVALSGSPIGGPGVDESKLPPPDKTADGIGVFDVQQNKLLRLIPSGSDPENFDLSKDGRQLFVSNEDDATHSNVDLSTAHVVRGLSVGEEPEGVTVSPDGKFVYVTSEDTGAISVLDTASSKLIKTFKVGRRPRSIVFAPDGSRAYVNAENDGAVVVIDAVKHQALQAIRLGQPGVIKPMGLALSADGKTLYVTTGRGHSVFVLDTATNQVKASFEVGERPWGIALSPDGKTLYTANGPANDVSVVDLNRRTVTRKIKVRGGPWGVLVL